ncbi:MAG: hypothetical protein ACRDLV_09135, partial [Solirubrobacteraceae bacterium]
VQTMQPVVLRGRAGLALPAEEFAPRVAAIQRELARQGLDALVLYGDARAYAPVAWVTGYVPMLKWAVAVVPADGGVELYLGSPGRRDLPAMRRLAVAASVDGMAPLGHALERHRRVALAGGRHIRARQAETLQTSTTVAGDGDALLRAVAAEPSPAEVRLLRAAAGLTQEAADVVAQMWENGAGAGPALLAGDLSARERGAHDVRLLWSPDGGRSLRPYSGPVPMRPDPFAFYLAVELGGYWGEAFRTPGAMPDEPPAAHPAVPPAARMWLSIEETFDPPVRPGVYSIRSTTTSGAVTSETVVR